MKQSYSVLSLIFLLIILPMATVYSQNGIPDNKGKEFWLTGIMIIQELI